MKKSYEKRTILGISVMVLEALLMAPAMAQTSGSSSGTSSSSLTTSSMNSSTSSVPGASSPASSNSMGINTRVNSNNMNITPSANSSPQGTQGINAQNMQLGSDSQLSRDVMSQVNNDRTISDFSRNNFRVSNTNGNVYIRGVARTTAEKERIGALVRQSSGGATVYNELDVSIR